MKRQLLITGAFWLAMLAFMSVTEPQKLPVLVLLVPFLLMFGVFLQTWILVRMVYLRFNKDKAPLLHKRLGASVSAVVVLLIILQSLGQLTLRDVITVVAIGALGYLYVLRGRVQPGKP